MVGCTVTSVISQVGQITTAAEDALASNDPQVAKYADLIAGGAGCALGYLQSSATTVIKSADALSCFAGIVAPVLPAGTPQTVLTYVANIEQYVQSFLAQYRAAVRVGAASTPQGLGFVDRWRIRRIRSKVDSIHQRALIIEQAGVKAGP